MNKRRKTIKTRTTTTETLKKRATIPIINKKKIIIKKSIQIITKPECGKYIKQKSKKQQEKKGK